MSRCEQDSTNGRRPPAAPGIAPRYSGRRFDPRRPLMQHERALHAGTAEHVRSVCMQGRSRKQGFLHTAAVRPRQ